ncbi:MAG: GNAT family N-acetyltransferase, partial [Butyricicoccus sp.]
MEIIHLNRSEFERVLPLVWDVFLTYEAANYPENGKKSFYDAIHSKEYLDILDMYAAFDGTQIVGVIATRENKTHIALFFV